MMRKRERMKRSSIGNCCKIRGCEIRRESLLPRVFLTFASTSKRSKRVARTDPRQFSGTNFSKRFGKRSSLSRVFPLSGRCVESCNYFFERFLQETSFNTPQRWSLQGANIFENKSFESRCSLYFSASGYCVESDNDSWILPLGDSWPLSLKRE